MFRPLSVIVALALLASMPSPVAGEVVNHAGYIVALDGDLEMLLWVSEEVLNASEPPEAFPIGWWPTVERARAALQGELWSSSECGPRPDEESGRQQVLGEATSPSLEYADLLVSSSAVVLGEVRQVEPGANVFGEVAVAPRVRVAVSEVLRDANRSLLPGGEVTYLGSGGRLRVGARLLCSPEAPERAVPETGATVILTGSSPSPGTDLFLNTSTVFGLRDGTVELPAGTRFEEREVPLEELRLAASTVEEGDGR